MTFPFPQDPGVTPDLDAALAPSLGQGLPDRAGEVAGALAYWNNILATSGDAELTGYASACITLLTNEQNRLMDPLNHPDAYAG